MIENKVFKTLLELYIANANPNANMKEPEEYGDYLFLIMRANRHRDDPSDCGVVYVEITQVGSDRFKLTMEATEDEDSCCGARRMYIKDPIVEHANPSDPCQVRIAQMFLKKAVLPFTLYVYHAIGIKV